MSRRAFQWNTQPYQTEENINIWDVELNDEDMQKIAELDLGKSEIVNHYDPNFVKMLHNLKIHE